MFSVTHSLEISVSHDSARPGPLVVSSKSRSKTERTPHFPASLLILNLVVKFGHVRIQSLWRGAAAAVGVTAILYNFRNISWEESRTVKALVTSLPLPALCPLALNETHLPNDGEFPLCFVRLLNLTAHLCPCGQRHVNIVI